MDKIQVNATRVKSSYSYDFIGPILRI